MGGGTSKIALPQRQLPPGYTAIVTSGHAGMGYEVSKVLAMMGARVILANDSPARAKAAILRMKADCIESKMKDNEEEAVSDSLSLSDSSQYADMNSVDLKLEYIRLNLKSLRSVEEFVAKFKERGYGLNLLVCNHAVVQVPQGYTEDGFETHFQVNYLGHLLLTLKLLPLMKVTGDDARVIMVSSTSHANGDFNLKKMQGRSGYDKSKYYANSRLYQVMIVGCLDRRLKDTNVSVFGMRAGSVDSDVKKKLEDPDAWSTAYNIGWNVGGALTKLVAGVNTCLNACLHPDIQGLSGAYFSDGMPVPPHQKATNMKNQEVLWRYSLDCLKDHLTRDLLEDLQLSLEDIGLVEVPDQKNGAYEL